MHKAWLLGGRYPAYSCPTWPCPNVAVPQHSLRRPRLPASEPLVCLTFMSPVAGNRAVLTLCCPGRLRGWDPAQGQVQRRCLMGAKSVMLSTNNILHVPKDRALSRHSPCNPFPLAQCRVGSTCWAGIW